ncbi:MAG: putative metallo-hydrolase [Promethearchaeota archaeon]|nr:MAG: putative metallo-hydrolase [Candidatus Lokiarchaeota archaeon]
MFGELKLGHIIDEGKINQNSYLIDAEFFKLEKTLALYVIQDGENNMMIDTGEALTARKIVKKLRAFNLYPLGKILFSHAHWDHIQAFHKIKRLIKETEIEILAHENAVDILKNPEEMNDFFGYCVDPIDVDIELKEGDTIQLGDIELEIYEFFGHTQDSIAIYNKNTRNIFVGDAIIDKIDYDTYVPVLFGPHFDEDSLLKSYEKLRNMKEKIDSIAFAHFGVYNGEDIDKILDNLEDMYFQAKNNLVQWYNEGLSIQEITKKYHDEIIPNSEIFSEDKLMGLQWNISQNIDTLKAAGFID